MGSGALLQQGRADAGHLNEELVRSTRCCVFGCKHGLPALQLPHVLSIDVGLPVPEVCRPAGVCVHRGWCPHM